MSLMGRLRDSGLLNADVLASLIEKRDDIYGYIMSASIDASSAYADTAAMIMQI